MKSKVLALICMSTLLVTMVACGKNDVSSEVENSMEAIESIAETAANAVDDLVETSETISETTETVKEAVDDLVETDNKSDEDIIKQSIDNVKNAGAHRITTVKEIEMKMPELEGEELSVLNGNTVISTLETIEEVDTKNNISYTKSTNTVDILGYKDIVTTEEWVMIDSENMTTYSKTSDTPGWNKTINENTLENITEYTTEKLFTSGYELEIIEENNKVYKIKMIVPEEFIYDMVADQVGDIEILSDSIEFIYIIDKNNLVISGIELRFEDTKGKVKCDGTITVEIDNNIKLEIPSDIDVIEEN